MLLVSSNNVMLPPNISNEDEIVKAGLVNPGINNKNDIIIRLTAILLRKSI